MLMECQTCPDGYRYEIAAGSCLQVICPGNLVYSNHFKACACTNEMLYLIQSTLCAECPIGKVLNQ